MANDRAAGMRIFFDERQLKVSVRGELGRWISVEQAELRNRHRRIADNLQADVVKTIQSRIKRKRVSTGRLLKVTADPQNQFADFTGLGVGNDAFLDKSVAKYWRTIEEGSAATWKKRSFLSLELQGLWGDRLGEWHYTAKSGPWVSGKGKETARGKGMYTPFRIGRGGGPSKLPIFHPGHDITPMNAYRNAARKANLREEGVAEARAYIEKTLGKALRPGGFSETSPKFDAGPLKEFSQFDYGSWDDYE